MAIEKLPVIVVWGLGWAAALVVLALAGAVAGFEDIAAAHYVAAAVIGAVAFGLPMRHGARATGSATADLQGLLWTIGFFAAAVVLGAYFEPLLGLAEAGELNINTTETMRQRAAQAYPQELLFSVATFGTFVVGCGCITGILASRGREPGSRLLSGAAFGVGAAAAVVAGLVVAVVGVPVLGHVTSMGLAGSGRELPAVALGFGAGSFLAGAAVGAVIEPCRRLLMMPTGVRAAARAPDRGRG